MKNFVFRNLLKVTLGAGFGLVMSLSLASCGGGGGGGGSGSSRTGARLLHGSIDSAPYNLISSNDPTVVVATARFGEASDRRGIGKGEQILSIGITKGAEPNKFSFPITVDKGFKQSILLFGNVEDGNLGANLINDDAGEIPSGSSMVKVINGVNSAAAVIATLTGIEPVEVSFGSSSEYVQISPGVYDFTVKRKSDGNQFYSSQVTFEKNKAYSLWIGGEGQYLVSVKQLQD